MSEGRITKVIYSDQKFVQMDHQFSQCRVYVSMLRYIEGIDYRIKDNLVIFNPESDFEYGDEVTIITIKVPNG